MRPIITFIFSCLLGFSLNAQVIEVPLLGNPILQAHAASNPSINLRSGSQLGTTFVAEGGTTVVCVDTTAINLNGFFASANCTNCGSTLYGTGDLSGLCLTYTSTMGNNLVVDDICIEICSTTEDCKEYTYSFETRSAFQLDANNPFFDDFSYSGPFPDGSLWLDQDVFINNTIAINPPSVGFATFDGLDRTGTPYGGGLGLSDALTTNFIDLSSFSAGSVIYLGFHIQEKGLSFVGPQNGDTLIVEGKLADGTWNRIEQFIPTPSSSFPDGFLPISRELDDPNYFHNGFQLRFKNYSKNQGAIEQWHVDYVSISATPVINALYDDIAFTSVPSTFLSRYTAMPWKHFENNFTDEFSDAYLVNLVNHFDAENDVQNTKQNITELTTGIELADFVLLDGSQFNITDTLPVTYERTIPSGVQSTIQSLMESSFSGLSELMFQTTYAYNVGNEQSGVDALTRNDTVSLVTPFTNYFAHDDGTAEGALVAPNAGDRIAVQFHANVADSLRGVQFHFPRISNGAATQLLNVQVYVGELDDEPEYNLIFQTPYFVDTDFDSLQGFTNYALLDFDGNPTPLFIPEGDFYVGWQQVTNTANAIPVGVDKNNLAASQYGFYSSASSWTPIGPGGLVDGAIMVRAVLGDMTPYNTPVNEIPTYGDEIVLFPNPAKHYLNVENVGDTDLDYQILDANGRVVKKGILDGTIDIAQLLNGMYFLKLDDPEKGMITKRFIVIQ